MKGVWKIAVVFAFVSLISIDGYTADELKGMSAVELIRKVETQYQGKTAHSVARMKVVTENWTREMTLESWSEGRDTFLARILSPKKDQGTATLRIKDDMWNYIPKIDRMIKIPSSLMGDSWMGSHLTNDDIVKENKIDELYDLTVAESDEKHAKIVGIPKPDAAVVWGRIEYNVDLERTIPVDILYYDEDGELVRTMAFDNVKLVDQRWLPMRMMIEPEDEPDEYTEFLYDEIEFDVKLKKDLFSIRSLRAR